ncbi:hypothetical protein VULLAG_LOCUS18087 [Vulpes lagopus]
MRGEPALVAGRQRPARGHRPARGSPARGWPGNALRSGSAPCRRRRGAGRADPRAGGGRRAAREGGRREPSRPRVCAARGPVTSPRGAAARVVRNQGAAARARRPAPPRPAPSGSAGAPRGGPEVKGACPRQGARRSAHGTARQTAARRQQPRQTLESGFPPSGGQSMTAADRAPQWPGQVESH